MKFELKNTGLALTVILGGSALAYTFLIFVPAQRALAEVREEIHSRQLYVLDTTSLEAELLRLQGEMKETQAYIEQQQQSLPAAADLARYTGELTSCASSAGVRIARFSPQFQQTGPILSRVPVSIAVEGELAQVFAFAARLESLEVPLWCQQFTVEADPKQAGHVRAEFDLLIFANNSEKSG